MTLESVINSLENLSLEEQQLLRQKLQNNLTRSAQKVEISEQQNPWLKYTGMFKNDPQFEEFLDEIKAYRNELDAEEIEENNKRENRAENRR